MKRPTSKAGPGRRGFKIDWGQAAEGAWRFLVLIAALALLVEIATHWNEWVGRAGWQATDDAYLESDFTPIAAQVPGYVRDVPVQDFARVRGGQTLASIVDDNYRAEVDRAAASLAASAAQVETLKAQYVFQEANVAAAQAVTASTAAALDQNARDVARERRLLETGSGSTEALEKLQTTREQLTAQLVQNRAQAVAAARQLGVLAAQSAEAQAAVAGQKASLQLARINLGWTRIVAPQDGVIGQRQVHPGQFVGVGSQITSFIPLPRVWVIANFKETQLTHMAPGERAVLTVDAFPGRVMKGHVQSFAPGSGAQFALLPPDNATGNFTKVVQRVAIKIVIDDAAGLADALRPGMSVEASVDARSREP